MTYQKTEEVAVGLGGRGQRNDAGAKRNANGREGGGGGGGLGGVGVSWELKRVNTPQRPSGLWGWDSS